MIYLIASVCVVVVIVSIFIFRGNAKRKEMWKGSHCVVTGGSAGLGLSIATELVQLGASVTILARNPNRLEEARKTLLDVKVSEDVSVLELFENRICLVKRFSNDLVIWFV